MIILFHFIFNFRSWFNSINEDNDLENMEAYPKPLMKLGVFLNNMTQSDISIRRSMLIFISICIIFEYQSLEKLEMKLYEKSNIDVVHSFKDLCFQKFMCLDIFIEATAEIAITFRDIENFEKTFSNFLPNESFGLSLGEIYRKMFSNAQDYYNPRSLKDLTRCKIRESLRCSTTLPAQVYQLPIPVILKEFLLFVNETIWESLKYYQQILYTQHKISRDVGK